VAGAHGATVLVAVSNEGIDRTFTLVRIDALSGDELHRYNYDVTDGPVALSVVTTADGFAAVGSDRVLRASDLGSVQWHLGVPPAEGLPERRVGLDQGRAVVQTEDGGYLVAAVTRSVGANAQDVWLLRLEADGTIRWQRTLPMDEVSALVRH